MKNKLKRAFTGNIGLKILAVVFAVALWYTVVNIDNPTQTKSFTTNVTVANADVLTDQGEYYSVDDADLNVTFRVTAKRSVLEQLSGSDFTAVADMNNLDRDNSRIPIEITAEKYSSSVTISAKVHYLSVVIGKEQSSKFVIDAVASGTPADGFAAGETVATPNVITVTGPAETVSSIADVRAECDITGMNTDVKETVVPEFYDKNGKKMDTTGLELSVPTVTVSVEMLSTKELPITVQTTGTLADGLTLLSVSSSPQSVAVKGTGDALNSITGITIPGSVVNLSTITSDFTTTVDITSYLPDGVSLVDTDNSQVTISVKLQAKKTESFSIPTANLTVSNLPDSLSVSFPASTVTAEITGLQSDLDSLDASKITGSIDASGLSAGSHSVSVQLNLDSSVYTVSTITCDITLKEAKSNGQ